MSKKKKGPDKPQNFVQKHMHEFNHARTFRDKKNDYNRKQKHRNKDYGAFFMTLLDLLISRLYNK